MLLIQLAVALVIALSSGNAPAPAHTPANQVSLEGERDETRRPEKPEEPQPTNVTWGELKGLYR